ncbi:MAG: hypothetical protein JRJ18_16545 [Deltaproteobacteria bacterium]|nr:hypothetical protein [Deltaproteobacteria bacterium]
METAEKELGGTVWALRPMPLDFWWSVRRFVRRTNPSVFLLVETDIWPGLLAHLKNKGVSAILVNGRVSPRTMRSYARFKPVFRHIYKGFHRCLMQTDLDRDRLLRLGLDQGRVVTAGNLKFDRAWEPLSPEERSGWFRTLGLEPERPVLVAGSTHPGEEEMVLEACERARRVAGDFCLIIAPRRVERAEEVARAAGARGFRTAMRSAGPRRGPPWDVLILDTIGELRAGSRCLCRREPRSLWGAQSPGARILWISGPVRALHPQFRGNGRSASSRGRGQAGPG